MTSPQEIDLQIDSLQEFVATSWSNIAISDRLANLYYLVPPGNRRAKDCFAAAARAARNSGSLYLINKKINRLRAALKGTP